MPSLTAKTEMSRVGLRAAAFSYLPCGSRQINGIFSRYTSLIQPLSLDEVDLDVTTPLLDRGSATAIARELKAVSEPRLVSQHQQGCPTTSFLAMLASDHHKPDGLLSSRRQWGLVS